MDSRQEEKVKAGVEGADYLCIAINEKERKLFEKCEIHFLLHQTTRSQ